jgi:hypothetical protein
VAKVIVRKLGNKAAKRGRSSLSEKRLFNSEGKLVKVLTIDSNSSSFSSDLHLVFQKNVAKARRENKKRFGSADRVRQKA